MIGKVTWTGHITCGICTEQVVEIQWGEARKTLRSLGWKQIQVKGDKSWYCPSCQHFMEEKNGQSV